MPARLRRFLLLVLVFSPALFTIAHIGGKAVDVSAWDDWELASVIVKWHDGTLTWGDLYAAQIQHRMVVPRLIAIALHNLSGGDFRWQVYACVGLVVLNAALLWMLLQRTMPGSPWRWLLMFVFNLMLFSPMHYETQFWGSSMWGGVPMPCLLAALLVLNPVPRGNGLAVSNTASWVRMLIALLLAEVATHSFAHGLALWPVLLLMLLANPTLGPLRTRLIQGGVWLVAAALTVWAYFTNFINVAFHAYNLKPGDPAMSGGSSILEGDNLAKAGKFILGYIGSWFSRSAYVDHPLDRAIVLGALTLPLFALIAGFALLSRKMRTQWASLLPWLGLGAYALAVGVMLSKRASDAGLHRAVMNRYLAPSQYVLISGIALATLVGAGLIASAVLLLKKYKALPSSVGELPRSTPAIAGALLITAFCVAQVPLWQHGLHLTEAAHRARRHAQSLMILLPHLQEQKKLISMKPLCKSFDYCLNAMNELQRIGLLRTKPLATPDLKQFRQEDKPLLVERADVTGARLLADGTIELDGYARFGAEAPADLVLVVQGGRIVGIGQPTPKHILRIYGLDFDMTNVAEVSYGSMFPWRGRINPALLPNPAEPVEFWALDVTVRRVEKFSRSLTLDPATKQPVLK